MKKEKKIKRKKDINSGGDSEIREVKEKKEEKEKEEEKEKGNKSQENSRRHRRTLHRFSSVVTALGLRGIGQSLSKSLRRTDSLRRESSGEDGGVRSLTASSELIPLYFSLISEFSFPFFSPLSLSPFFSFFLILRDSNVRLMLNPSDCQKSERKGEVIFIKLRLCLVFEILKFSE